MRRLPRLSMQGRRAQACEWLPVPRDAAKDTTLAAPVRRSAWLARRGAGARGSTSGSLDEGKVGTYPNDGCRRETYRAAPSQQSVFVDRPRRAPVLDTLFSLRMRDPTWAWC